MADQPGISTGPASPMDLCALPAAEIAIGAFQVVMAESALGEAKALSARPSYLSSRSSCSPSLLPSVPRVTRRNPRRAPGGSTGGGAAAVVTGMAAPPCRARRPARRPPPNSTMRLPCSATAGTRWSRIPQVTR